MEANIVLVFLALIVLATIIIKNQAKKQKLKKSAKTMKHIYATDKELKDWIEFQEDVSVDYLDDISKEKFKAKLSK